MSAPEELTPAEVEELRGDLQALQAELETLLTNANESARAVELDQAVVGRLSRMDALQGQQMASATLRRAKVRHQQVLAALARIRAGDYGLCVRSGDPIGYPRLKARPETPFSLESQAELER